MNVVTREAMLAATGCPEEAVYVPGLKGWVVVRGLSGEALDAYHEAIMRGKGKNREVNARNLRVKLLVRTLHVAVPVPDQPGKFTAGALLLREDDIVALSRIRGDIIGQLFPISQRVSGLSDEEADELGSPSE
jgi:hypothetical protein